MGKSELKEVVFQVSEGILERLTDFLLWYFFLVGASVGKNTRNSYQAFIEADKALGEINYQSFKRALDRLRKGNFLSFQKKRNCLEIEISKQGRERLLATVPSYQEKRIWDKKLYLITYDIPEKKSRDRDALRYFLRKIGCEILQESVWITPYNPSEILADFVKERRLEETILVSDLGLEGTIGGEDIKSLVRRIYKLDSLNSRYREFIEKYSGGNFPKTAISFAFYNILADDPQVPFETLPEGWLGEKAYNLLLPKLTSMTSGRELKRLDF
jgi:DNA-binding transcriptional regulator PaaX